MSPGRVTSSVCKCRRIRTFDATIKIGTIHEKPSPEIMTANSRNKTSLWSSFLEDASQMVVSCRLGLEDHTTLLELAEHWERRVDRLNRLVMASGSNSQSVIDCLSMDVAQAKSQDKEQLDGINWVIDRVNQGLESYSTGLGVESIGRLSVRIVRKHGSVSPRICVDGQRAWVLESAWSPTGQLTCGLFHSLSPLARLGC